MLVFTALNFHSQAEEATDMSTETPALNPGNEVNDPGIPLQDGPKRDFRLSPTNRIAVVALVLTGFLALVYEICWMRQSTLILGSTTFAVSTVLAVFLGGLALGNYFFGRISKHHRQPMRLYANLEIGVGLLVGLEVGLEVSCCFALLIAPYSDWAIPLHLTYKNIC